MNYRKFLIRIVTFLGGLYFFLEFVLPSTVGGFAIDMYHDQISTAFTTVGVMAIGLGVINLLVIHGSRVAFAQKRWINSLALLIGMFAMFVVMSWDWLSSRESARYAESFFTLRDFSAAIRADAAKNDGGANSAIARSGLLAREVTRVIVSSQEVIDAVSPEALFSVGSEKFGNFTVEKGSLLEKISIVREETERLSVESGYSTDRSIAVEKALSDAGVAMARFQEVVRGEGLAKKCYNLLYEGLFVSLASAMFALLGFYIIGAAYRAFRVRSFESALMMAAAVIVMLGQIPFGSWIYEDLPSWRLWILQVPNAAAFRAIQIGAAVAGLIMAVRMWFCIESDFGAGREI